jgi:hypothetical protein
MHLRQWTSRFILLALVFVFTSVSARTDSAEIWFFVPEPFFRNWKGWEPNDFMELFTPTAQWATGASALQILLLSNQFVIFATDEQLNQIISDMKRRHIALAMAGLMLTASARCGQHVEGYSGPIGILRAAGRVKQLGGVLKYIAMDEPLLYGHYYSGPNACHDSIADVAKQVAEKVAQAKSVFPQIKVGDIETLGAGAQTHWMEQMQQWPAAYQAAVGEPLAFMQADISWQNPNWQSDLQAESQFLRAARIPLGIIYNGSPQDQTDLEWTTHAEQRFHLIESNLRIIPDQAIIATWTVHPTRMLPENQPATMTYLLKQYVQMTHP